MLSSRRRLLVAIVILILCLSPRVRAFETGIHNEITRAVIDAYGAKRPVAPDVYDKINAGNLKADNWDPSWSEKDPYDFSKGEGVNEIAHFDAEQFEEAAARIKRWLGIAAAKVRGGRRDEALHAIGRAFHPVQDFFAHSNLIELEERDGRIRMDLLTLKNPPRELLCDRVTHLTTLGGVAQTGLAGLTSAYFSFDDLNWARPGKCSHTDLNKDHPAPKHLAEDWENASSNPELAKRLHPRAVARAKEYGIYFLGQVEDFLLIATDREHAVYLFEGRQVRQQARP